MERIPTLTAPTPGAQNGLAHAAYVKPRHSTRALGTCNVTIAERVLSCIHYFYTAEGRRQRQLERLELGPLKRSNGTYRSMSAIRMGFHPPRRGFLATAERGNSPHVDTTIAAPPRVPSHYSVPCRLSHPSPTPNARTSRIRQGRSFIIKLLPCIPGASASRNSCETMLSLRSGCTYFSSCPRDRRSGAH